MEVEGNNRVHVRGNRQTEGGGVGCPGEKGPPAQRLQGKGNSLPGRSAPFQAGQGSSPQGLEQFNQPRSNNAEILQEMPRDRDARKLRNVRHRRVRKKVSGSPDQPRLCVFRSLRSIYAQIIDDTGGKTWLPRPARMRQRKPGQPIHPKTASFYTAVGTAVGPAGLGAGHYQGSLRPGRVQVPRTGQGLGRRSTRGRSSVLMVSTANRPRPNRPTQGTGRRPFRVSPNASFTPAALPK